MNLGDSICLCFVTVRSKCLRRRTGAARKVCTQRHNILSISRIMPYQKFDTLVRWSLHSMIGISEKIVVSAVGPNTYARRWCCLSSVWFLVQNEGVASAMGDAAVGVCVCVCVWKIDNSTQPLRLGCHYSELIPNWCLLMGRLSGALYLVKKLPHTSHRSHTFCNKRKYSSSSGWHLNSSIMRPSTSET